MSDKKCPNCGGTENKLCDEQIYVCECTFIWWEEPATKSGPPTLRNGPSAVGGFPKDLRRLSGLFESFEEYQNAKEAGKL